MFKTWRPWRKQSTQHNRVYQLLPQLDRSHKKYRHFGSYLSQTSVRGRLKSGHASKQYLKVILTGLSLLGTLLLVIWLIYHSLAAFALF